MTVWPGPRHQCRGARGAVTISDDADIPAFGVANWSVRTDVIGHAWFADPPRYTASCPGRIARSSDGIMVPCRKYRSHELGRGGISIPDAGGDRPERRSASRPTRRTARPMPPQGMTVDDCDGRSGTCPNCLWPAAWSRPDDRRGFSRAPTDWHRVKRSRYTIVPDLRDPGPRQFV